MRNALPGEQAPNLPQAQQAPAHSTQVEQRFLYREVVRVGDVLKDLYHRFRHLVPYPSILGKIQHRRVTLSALSQDQAYVARILRPQLFREAGKLRTLVATWAVPDEEFLLAGAVRLRE